MFKISMSLKIDTNLCSDILFFVGIEKNGKTF